MKYILTILFSISYCLNTFGQVGVDTENPQSTLDIRGDLTIRDKIYAGGSDQELGDSGRDGQVLVSQGEGNPPIWKSLNIPVIQPGGFYIIFTDAYGDDVGLSFSNNETIGETPFYNKGDLRTDSKFNRWKDIDGLTKEFMVYNSDNKAYITYEAVIQISGQGQGYVDFACGVFVNDRLQGIRTETIRQLSGANHPFLTFLMVVIAEDINVGTNEAKVSCARIRSNGYSGALGVGRAIETNINNFVSQSSMKIEVYEIPENFIPIVN